MLWPSVTVSFALPHRVATNASDVGIGSGGLFATAAARALIDVPGLSAEQIGRKAMGIAADMCDLDCFRFAVCGAAHTEHRSVHRPTQLRCAAGACTRTRISLPYPWMCRQCGPRPSDSLCEVRTQCLNGSPHTRAVLAAVTKNLAILFDVDTNGGSSASIVRFLPRSAFNSEKA